MATSRTLLALLIILSAACIEVPTHDASGQDIYQQVCARCHGPELEGLIGPPLGPGSNTAQLPDEFIRIAVLDGRGRMPSFVSTLDDEQVDRLIDYIREQQDAG